MPIQVWRSLGVKEISGKYFLIPFSEVKTSLLEVAAGLAGLIQQTQELRKSGLSIAAATDQASSALENTEHFDLSVNGTFEKKDLRLSLAEIESLRGLDSARLDSGIESEAASPMDFPVLPDKSSTSQLHELFYRVLHFGVSKKSGDIWNQIRQDAKLEKGTRKFDEESILVHVDATKIKWRSRYDRTGEDQEFSRDSLGPTLTKIRKWVPPVGQV